MPAGVVIIGAGQAGGELATNLRRLGSSEPIVLLGDEPFPPYQRPPLSKSFLDGALTREALFLKSLATYAKFTIDFRAASRVERIDRSARTVTLGDGSSIGWTTLVLATGGRARPLRVPGLERPASNVFFVRSIADVEEMRPRLESGKRLVIIGGGYIGLEVASVAVKRGLSVTVIEAAERLLPRVTGVEMAGFLEALHRENGVRFELGRCVTHVVRADDAVTAVGLGDEVVDADLVLIGVGLVPNTELAIDAGLSVDDGIVVDAHAVTSDPHVMAIGDCANQPSSYLGRRVRLESVPNAIEHARIAALAVLGRPETSAAVPWFWSEQYGRKLQMIGLAEGTDRTIVRSQPFATFALKGDVLRAAELIDNPADFAVARQLVASGARVDARLLADPSIPLTQTRI